MSNHTIHNNFIDNLLQLIQKSIVDVSLKNDSFVEFMSLFDKINYPKDEIILLNAHYSCSLYEMLQLDVEQLQILYDFLMYIQSNLPDNEMVLFEENLNRGKKDILWIIDISSLQANIFKHFKKIQPLKKNQIIDSYYRGQNKQLELYFIDLLENKNWTDLSQEELLLFLQGGDFYFLSEIAYFFILPACINLCIDLLKNGDYNDVPLEYISYFLKNANMFKSINSNAQFIVNNFIDLLSRQSYYFFSLDDYDLQELSMIWGSKFQNK
ncbi:hypothetical protein [Capnocytophaga sp.]|uniref:hypothetical protein n=1 Tax=Capnocytophaga sp. TaxID=44737 RepID=UPI0026DC86ED|nr:hypothetical protein [Capnocytophaga sp.]MDO5106180.1 hypothetical protein [Capnocytophaga sp.]